MRSIQKSFRLKAIYNQFLIEKSQEMQVSQADIVEVALDKLMKDSEQWEKDLALIAKDEGYKKEQRDLANEFYEDF